MIIKIEIQIYNQLRKKTTQIQMKWDFASDVIVCVCVRERDPLLSKRMDTDMEYVGQFIIVGSYQNKFS